VSESADPDWNLHQEEAAAIVMDCVSAVESVQTLSRINREKSRQHLISINRTGANMANQAGNNILRTSLFNIDQAAFRLKLDEQICKMLRNPRERIEDIGAEI